MYRIVIIFVVCWTSSEISIRLFCSLKWTTWLVLFFTIFGSKLNSTGVEPCFIRECVKTCQNSHCSESIEWSHLYSKPTVDSSNIKNIAPIVYCKRSRFVRNLCRYKKNVGKSVWLIRRVCWMNYIIYSSSSILKKKIYTILYTKTTK